MSSHSTRTAILSLTAPGTSILAHLPTASATLAREINEYGSKLHEENPTRFGFFASLPHLTPETIPSAIEEIAYALDILHADGITLYTRYNGTGYLGHEAFEPLWKELNHRKAVVFIHPTNTASDPQKKPVLVNQKLPQPIIDYPHETCRTAVDLITSGTISRNPDVNIILSHGGGTLPILATRAANLLYDASLTEITPEVFLEQVKKFYFDLALSGDHRNLELLLGKNGLAEKGHVLYGSDFPYAPVQTINTFTEWAKTYGGLYSFRIGSATAVLITDRELVKELFDKRSALYSSRPVSHVGQNLITGGDHLLVMNNNDSWRLFRKTVHQHFKAANCEKDHVKLLEAEHTQMMRDFLLFPKNHLLHPKRTTNSIIMSLLYGIRTPSCDVLHMQQLYEIMEKWSKIMETGATPPVDIFPWLKWIPQHWLGNWIDRSMEVCRGMKGLYGSFRRRAIEARQNAERNSQIRAHTFMDYVLDLQEKVRLTDNQVDFLGGVMMEGASDTGSTMLLVMIQAMVQHPEIQEQARAELDAVCGENRSPTWADFRSLPYINMIVKETMRWRPVTPLAFPHALSQDDWVNGYLLPKGTTVFLNVWGLHHDESVFPNPEVFDPSRYKGRHNLASDSAASPDYMQRDHYIYGAGRRLCPGIHLSEWSMFLGVAKLLWGFRFEHEVDENGNPVEIDTDPITGYTEGFLVCPKPYRCKVVPRSKAHAETILREFASAESGFLSRYATP
ncbi:hypothetical protein N7520_003636 [Penicillium odoratum]|uniref:uncharacterized protein n=1 Tax=Penicillium odoratum TaxID=1167516 RepID=UPI002548753F|nr:uncharacterized protein N7520_003636 [Penicillium odoratum]KAJ5769077.1 hypothetical protein N7520_003636 [Penicillium odoratum]